MTRMHKDVGEDLPRGKHSSWSGHITSKHSPEHTDSSKVDGAGMHVREQHAPGLAELAGLERALLHETVHRDMEHEACPEKIGSRGRNMVGELASLSSQNTQQTPRPGTPTHCPGGLHSLHT